MFCFLFAFLMMASGFNADVSVFLFPCRKQCLWLNNFVAIIGAVLMLLSKTATSFEMIMVGRFLYGINAGEPTVRGNPFPLSFLLIFFIDGLSITFGSPVHPTDNRFLFILVTIILLSSPGHLSSSYWSLLTLSECMIPLCAPVGISLSAHTIYLVECAPKILRAMVGVTIATFVSCGKFSGQLLGIRWGVTDTAESRVESSRGQVEVGFKWRHWPQGLKTVASVRKAICQTNCHKRCWQCKASFRHKKTWILP